MTNLRRYLLLSLALLTLVFGAGSALAQGTPVASPQATEGYAHPEWLAEVAWLQERLDDPALTVIALTPAEEFAAAHVPGAAQVDWPAFEIVETSDQSVSVWREDVERILTDLGVHRDDTVVVYDGGTFYAARLWWILHQLGHEDIRILNGGLGAWQTAGAETETGASSAAAADEPYRGEPNEDAIAQIDEVIAAVGDPDVALIDARRANEYVDGHIPGAVNVPFTENAVAEGAPFWKSAEELRQMYADAGVTPDKRVIPYCTTGVRSAATYFTLRLIGYEHVTLFSGSYEEWTSDPARPVATGEQP